MSDWAATSTKVFISYRRIDCEPDARRLHDSLGKMLGRRAVFRDAETISPGDNFVHELEQALRRTRVVLVLIGPKWGDELQRQLDAYNARDMNAWLATYAVDAKQYAYPGVLLASGHAEIRARMQERFTELNLHARLLGRSVLKTAGGATVIDHETIRRSFPDGPGELDMVAIYEVAGGLICSGLFILGEQRLD